MRQETSQETLPLCNVVVLLLVPTQRFTASGSLPSSNATPHLPDTSALYIPNTDPAEHDTHIASASLEVLSGRIPGTGSVLAGRPLPLP